MIKSILVQTLLIVSFFSLQAQDTKLIKDVIPGTTGVQQYNCDLISSGNLVYFRGKYGSSADGFYRTDGTDAGTFYLNTIANRHEHDPFLDRNMVTLNGRTLFLTYFNGNQNKVWVTDGTISGTFALSGITAASGTFNIKKMIVYNNEVYVVVTGFSTARGVYKWSGGSSFTQIVPATTANYGSDLNLLVGNNRLFYTENMMIYELTSGTAVALFNQNTINSQRVIRLPYFFNNRILFNETGDITIGGISWGLRSFDVNTLQHSVLTSNSESGFQAPTKTFDTRVMMGSSLYFSRSTYVNSLNYYELWTVSPSFQVSMIKQFPTNSSSPKGPLLAKSNLLLFGIGSNGGWSTPNELWISDGTLVGTTPIVQVSDSVQVVMDQREFAIDENKCLFIAKDIANNSNQTVNGFELWKTDFTEIGTNMAVEFATGYFGGLYETNNFGIMNDGKVVLMANYRVNQNSYYGVEPWITDGSDISIVSVKEQEKLMDIKLYPNPTHDYLIAENITVATEVMIYNMQGQLLQQKTISASDNMINLQSYVNGVYICHLLSDKFSVTKKITIH